MNIQNNDMTPLHIMYDIPSLTYSTLLTVDMIVFFTQKNCT
jgi:hypothetical protein